MSSLSVARQNHVLPRTQVEPDDSTLDTQLEDEDHAVSDVKDRMKLVSQEAQVELARSRSREKKDAWRRDIIEYCQVNKLHQHSVSKFESALRQWVVRCGVVREVGCK